MNGLRIKTPSDPRKYMCLDLTESQLGFTWRLLGSYKWGYKYGNYGFME